MQAAASIGPGAGPRLSWRDPALRWLLLLALVLQLASWWMQRGYPLADAVEFMERAQSWVNGEPLTDARTVRSFAFSTLFVPPFLAARALGLEDQRVVLVVARLLQVALALGLVAACARLAQRVSGRSAGLAAGFIVAVNPVLLTYADHPVSGIVLALCIALALDRLIEPLLQARPLDRPAVVPPALPDGLPEPACGSRPGLESSSCRNGWMSW